MNDDKTHYERTTTEERRAQRFVTKHGNDLVSAIQDMARAGRPMGFLDVVREYLAPIADLDFISFFSHPRCLAAQSFIAEVGAMITGGRGLTGEVRTQINVCWHQLQFRRHGQRTYVVAPGLAQRLLLTELRGVRGTDLELPYPSLYVSVPPELDLRINNAHTGEHVVYGVYVTEDNGRWMLLICGLPNANSVDDFDDAISHFVINLSEQPVEDSLREFKNYVMGSGDDWNQSLNMTGVEIDRWLRVFRWVMNLAFYVTRPGFDDIEHIDLNPDAVALWRRMQKAPKGAKRERIKALYRQTPKRPRIVVGRKVAFDPELPRTASDVTRPLTVRSLVAGHWQRYAVGRGRTERVWKYREPFWRGPEDGAEGSNIHEVR